jgi:hypothetical protein
LHAFSQKQNRKFYPIKSATNEHCKEKVRTYTHHIQESMQVCKFLLEALYNMNLNKRPPKVGLLGILYKVF